jgi:hypothetical protein
MNAGPCGRFERETLQEDARSWAELEAHAETCPECAARLALWREIDAAASSLRKRWESPDLDRAIERALAQGPIAGSSESGGGAASKPGLARYLPAAAIAAAILLSIVSVRVFRGSGGREPFSARPAARPALLNDAAMAEVETAETAYLASIDNLSRLAAARLSSSSSPLAAAYREKLLLLDSEIAEMRGEIERNRFNTHLRRELLAIYREKQQTLQELMRGES